MKDELKQGNDPRQNCQKPSKVLKTSSKGILTVYVGLDKNSGIYFKGKKEHYHGGATYNPTLKDFIVS